MGRRKKSTAAKKVKRPRPGLSTQFKCPFCAHEGSVECRLDRDQEIGSLDCRVCGATYSCSITYLSEPIDVFSEWIDACEAEAEEAKAADGKDLLAQAQDDVGDDDEHDQRRVRQRLDDDDDDD